MLLILRVLQQRNELSAVELAGKVKRGTPGIILGGGIGPASQKAPDVIQTIDQHGMVQGGGSLVCCSLRRCAAHVNTRAPRQNRAESIELIGRKVFADEGVIQRGHAVDIAQIGAGSGIEQQAAGYAVVVPGCLHFCCRWREKWAARGGWSPGLTSEQPGRNPRLQDGVLRIGLWSSALLLFRCRILSLFERIVYLLKKGDNAASLRSVRGFPWGAFDVCVHIISLFCSLMPQIVHQI